jgi:hypothetical protein
VRASGYVVLSIVENAVFPSEQIGRTVHAQ